MAQNISKKSAFVISMFHRKVTPKKNPKPNRPKNKIRSHDYSILIIDNVNEMIEFLNRYTDYDEFSNSDKLQQKQELKQGFCIDITEIEKLKKEILWDKMGYTGENFEWEYYDQHMISIRRLPVGVQKRHYNEDLY
nr:hypothetical protein [uncultured Draconibacterium sp.]